MALQSGSLMEANDVINYLGTKDRVKKTYHNLDGSFWSEETATHTDYLWIRSDASQYLADDYSELTEYGPDDRVTFNDGIWKCLSEGVIGVDPVEGNQWTYLWEQAVEGPIYADWVDKDYKDGAWVNHNGHQYRCLSDTKYAEAWESEPGVGDYWYNYWTDYGLYAEPGWYNLSFKRDGSGFGFGSTTRNITIYRRTWDELGVPIDTQVHYSGDEFGDVKFQLDPGYYKVVTYLRTGGGSLNISVNSTMYAKPWDNTMEADSLIKIMSTDFKELQTEEEQVTLTLARAGRLSSPNYLGGDFEVQD